MEKKIGQQKMRISDEELSVIKNTFAENDELLQVIRKAMLELAPVGDEKASLKLGPEVHGVLRKMLLPEIDGTTPLGQTIDLWMTVQISDKPPDMAHLLLKSRQMLIDRIEAGLKNLGDWKVSSRYTEFTLTDDPDHDYAVLIARNTYLNHVEQQLIQLRILAGQKDETVEQTKARLAMDSAK